MASQDFLPHLPSDRRALIPVSPRSAPLFSFGLLTAASVLASFAFACATPFSAFAVIAAAILPLPSALLVVAATWVVNQGIGFSALHYPVDGKTILWGVVMGTAALAGTVAAASVLQLARRMSGAIALALAIVAAYTAYELVLFAATPFLGGAGAFTAGIVGRIGAVNILWLLGLVAACETVRLLNTSRRHRPAS
jgi:hypothetical protein